MGHDHTIAEAVEDRLAAVKFDAARDVGVMPDDDIGTSVLGGTGLVSLSETRDAHRFAGTGGKDDRAAHDLI